MSSDENNSGIRDCTTCVYGGECFEIVGKCNSKFNKWKATDIEFIDVLKASTNKCKGHKVCHWKEEDPDNAHWVGSCGIDWCLTDGNPKAHGMNYCPKCGGFLLLAT